MVKLHFKAAFSFFVNESNWQINPCALNFWKSFRLSCRGAVFRRVVMERHVHFPKGIWYAPPSSGYQKFPLYVALIGTYWSMSSSISEPPPPRTRKLPQGVRNYNWYLFLHFFPYVVMAASHIFTIITFDIICRRKSRKSLRYHSKMTAMSSPLQIFARFPSLSLLFHPSESI